MFFSFEFEGQNHQVEAELIQGQLWIHFQGKTWSVGKESSGKKNRGQHKKGPQNEISAPMPGKIIKVAVQAGDKVEVGQILVVMEAMKMEYTLKADHPTQIKDVLVQNGQQVRLGETLVSFLNKDLVQ